MLNFDSASFMGFELNHPNVKVLDMIFKFEGENYYERNNIQ